MDLAGSLDFLRTLPNLVPLFYPPFFFSLLCFLGIAPPSFPQGSCRIPLCSYPTLTRRSFNLFFLIDNPLWKWVISVRPLDHTRLFSLFQYLPFDQCPLTFLSKKVIREAITNLSRYPPFISLHSIRPSECFFTGLHGVRATAPPPNVAEVSLQTSTPDSRSCSPA